MFKNQLHIEGYDAFHKYTKDLKESNIVFYFSGSKDPLTGENWCSDCRKGKKIQ